MSLCPLVFQQLLKETLAPIPTMLPTVADIKKDILDRADTAEWLRRRMGQLSDERKGVIVIPITKRQPEQGPGHE